MEIKNEALKKLINSTSTELHISPEDLLLEALTLYITEQEKKKVVEDLWSSSIAHLNLPSNVFVALIRYDINEIKDLINIELNKIPGIGRSYAALIEEHMMRFLKESLIRS